MHKPHTSLSDVGEHSSPINPVLTECPILKAPIVSPAHKRLKGAQRRHARRVPAPSVAQYARQSDRNSLEEQEAPQMRGARKQGDFVGASGEPLMHRAARPLAAQHAQLYIAQPKRTFALRTASITAIHTCCAVSSRGAHRLVQALQQRVHRPVVPLTRPAEAPRVLTRPCKVCRSARGGALLTCPGFL